MAGYGTCQYKDQDQWQHFTPSRVVQYNTSSATAVANPGGLGHDPAAIMDNTFLRSLSRRTEDSNHDLARRISIPAAPR